MLRLKESKSMNKRIGNRHGRFTDMSDNNTRTSNKISQIDHGNHNDSVNSFFITDCSSVF